MSQNEENEAVEAEVVDATPARSAPRSAIQITPAHEIAIAAETAREMRRIETRYAIAASRPRNLKNFRAQLIARCKSYDFADEAIYAVPRGKVKDEVTGEWVENIVEGLSIRFAEEALRHYPHLGVESASVYEDDDRRKIRLEVTDYESKSS